MITFRQCEFINLGAVLKRCGLNLESTRIKILINVTAKVPVTLHLTVDIQ